MLRSMLCHRWEARKHWGTITNRTRDMARHALVWIAPSNWDIAETIVRWTVAYAEVTKNHLRYEAHTNGLLGVLGQEERDNLEKCKHQPIFAMEKMSECLGRAYRAGVLTGSSSSLVLATPSVPPRSYMLLAYAEASVLSTLL